MEPRPVNRLAWVDVARGIGILLVVYGHALRAQVTAGQSDPAWHAALQDEVIYSFHMHLFFFLAGLFVVGSIAKGAAPFLRTKLITIVYPYVLWSVISALLGTLANGATNHEMDLGHVAGIWWKPIYQYWFLYALFVCDVVALAIRADRRIAIILVALSAAGLLTFLPGMLGVSAAYFAFFFGGAVLAPHVLKLRIAFPLALAIALVGTAILALSFWQNNMFVASAGAALTGLLRGIAGVAATLALSMIISARAPWLVIVGTASMAIYVMHTIFSAGLRIVMTALGVGEPTLSLIACTIIGVVAPLMIWAIALRLGLLTWLGLGSAISRKKEVGA